MVSKEEMESIKAAAYMLAKGDPKLIPYYIKLGLEGLEEEKKE